MGSWKSHKKLDLQGFYEVTGQIIKSVDDATDKLLDLQKKLRDIEEPKEKGPNNVTNALFVGSTVSCKNFLKKEN